MSDILDTLREIRDVLKLISDCAIASLDADELFLLIINNPTYLDNHHLPNIDLDYWVAILKKRPDLIKYCPTDDLLAYQWDMLLRRHPHLLEHMPSSMKKEYDWNGYEE